MSPWRRRRGLQDVAAAHGDLVGEAELEDVDAPAGLPGSEVVEPDGLLRIMPDPRSGQSEPPVDCLAGEVRPFGCRAPGVELVEAAKLRRHLAADGCLPFVGLGPDDELG